MRSENGRFKAIMSEGKMQKIIISIEMLEIFPLHSKSVSMKRDVTNVVRTCGPS